MLKLLKLRRKLELKRSKLAELNTNADFQKREAELETALAEMTTEEDEAILDTEIEKLETEKAAFVEETTQVEKEIEEIEKEIEKLEGKEPKEEPAEETTENAEPVKRSSENLGGYEMTKRNKYFGGMTRQAIEALTKREEVATFLENTRAAIGQNQTVTGTELTIPETILEILRDNLNEYSKLVNRVSVRSVSGKARQNILSKVPEAIWTEMIGKINALPWSLHQVEVDGYKVAGFAVLENSTIKDSDIDLMNEILKMLGQAIGLALDKAIVYGKGNKMPVGIVTRLEEDSKPKYWTDNEPEWKNLSGEHLAVVKSDPEKALASYQNLAKALNKIDATYAKGQPIWIMSRKTHQDLNINLMAFNFNGALASSVQNTLPVIGGEIVELNFIPDGEIIGGFADLYLLAEREGGEFSKSTEARFIEDQTVFKGVARYDGRPVFGEAFVGVTYSEDEGAVAPSGKSVTFAEDKANA